MCENNGDENIFACPNNSEVSCHPNKRNCADCGWNPDVAMDRLNRICKKLGVQVPGREEATAE